MYQAFHPEIDKLISVQEYKEYTLQLGLIKSSSAPKARCPVCRRDMGIRAGQQKDNSHFYHLDNKFCSTKDPAAYPFRRLKQGRQDARSALRNRQFVFNNLDQIYKRISELVPFFNFKEFIEILNEANRLNCYAYSKLKPELIPYIFVTLINFLPRNGKANSKTGENRRLKFCFFYDSRIESFDELWVHHGKFSDLLRISYESRCKPTKVQMIDTTVEYLQDCRKQMSDKQRNWCNNLISNA